MTIAEAHALAVAAEERVKELQHAVRFYDERDWEDLRDEYRIRLDEIQRLILHGQVASMPEGEARAMAGNR